MILNRLGNKKKIAGLIHPHFPPHSLYIELFFGAGGMFFNKPRARHNVCNDIDDNVYNLWNVLKENPEGLRSELLTLPIHEALWRDYKKKVIVDPVLKAVVFLMYSNFGYMGKPDTMRHGRNNTKEMLVDNITKAFQEIEGATFTSVDFRKVLPRVEFKDPQDLGSAFIYADPPYMGTEDNYSHSFTEQDTIDLFQLLVDSKIKFAVSEFDNPIVMDLASTHKLNVIHITERQTMKSRNTEILITNFDGNATLFELPPPPVSGK